MLLRGDSCHQDGDETCAGLLAAGRRGPHEESMELLALNSWRLGAHWVAASL